jgi:hypothetical protein
MSLSQVGSGNTRVPLITVVFAGTVKSLSVDVLNGFSLFHLPYEREALVPKLSASLAPSNSLPVATENCPYL